MAEAAFLAAEHGPPSSTQQRKGVRSRGRDFLEQVAGPSRDGHRVQRSLNNHGAAQVDGILGVFTAWTP